MRSSGTPLGATDDDGIILAYNLPLPCWRRGRAARREFGPGVAGPGSAQGTPNAELDVVVVV
jgi:hypothetical protein